MTVNGHGDSASGLPETLDCARIERETFAERLLYLPETPSTSDVALAEVGNSTGPWPLLVLTEHQTSGRGRGANSWWSARGSLTFSLVLPGSLTGLSTEHWPRLSLHVALAVAETLSACAPRSPVGLKWPNDVFLTGRKVCGILLEVPPARPDCLVIGIGCNVNNSLEQAPAELRNAATSLVDSTGTHHSRTDVLIHLLRELQLEIERLATGTADLATRWAPLCLVRGKDVTHSVAGQHRTGRCLGVANDGALLLETAGNCVPVYGGTLSTVAGLHLAR